MNSSRLNKLIDTYLGFKSIERDAACDELIADCLNELESLAHFRYVYKLFDSAPDFLKKPPYTEYLKGSHGVIIAVMTLGGEVDRRVKYLERADAARAVTLDACASAYLEELSDEYEAGLGLELSYRFCPGYGGSDVGDLTYIFDILKPEKIGLTLSPSGYMLPCKSMAGVIAVGGSAQKSCKDCVNLAHCGYLKEGVTCYGSEKK